MYEVHPPTSPLLQPHIFSFNLLRPRADLKHLHYFAFPQLGTSMALYPNAAITHDETQITFAPALQKQPTVLQLGKYLLPLYLKYTEYLPEISINFTPTGLNYFFDQNHDEIAPQQVQFLDHQPWLELAETLFETADNEAKIKRLEAFLLNQLKPKSLSIVEKALELWAENAQYKIAEIAEALAVSEKSITRNFKKYVGCSPVQYKRIVRFREAVSTKLEAGEDQSISLTELCFSSNFYDSPHFTREFKQLTNNNPRDFFKKVIPVGAENYPYVFS